MHWKAGCWIRSWLRAYVPLLPPWVSHFVPITPQPDHPCPSIAMFPISLTVWPFSWRDKNPGDTDMSMKSNKVGLLFLYNLQLHCETRSWRMGERPETQVGFKTTSPSSQPFLKESDTHPRTTREEQGEGCAQGTTTQGTHWPCPSSLGTP